MTLNKAAEQVSLSTDSNPVRASIDPLESGDPRAPRGLYQAVPRVAALFVQTNGCYFDLEGVDPWDIHRDARLYAGPHPVVAHPPCERWGRYWHGGPSAKVRQVKGDDGGCFAAALAAVRTWGGGARAPRGIGGVGRLRPHAATEARRVDRG